MRLKSFGIVVGILACTVNAPTAMAQCSPFTKFGMTRLNWTNGSTFVLGSTDNLDAAIALHFAYDATNTVALTAMDHRGKNSDGTRTLFQFSTVPPAGVSTALWKAVFRPVDADTPIEIGPSDAAYTSVWVDDPGAPRSALFQWFGATLPDPLSDSFFWMELKADIDPTQPWRVTWQSRLGRIARPNSTHHYTLDEVTAPIVHTAAPGNGLLSRVLVPIAQDSPLPAANLPLRLWQLIGYDLSFEHPARNQQLQFSALYSGDPTSLPIGSDLLSSWRKILYFGTEDAEGHYKRFLHKAETNGATISYRWATTYYPSYGLLPWINFHRSPYPVVMEALQAQSDSFWYDCTQRYRRFVERDMHLTRIADPCYALNPDFPRAAPFVANSNAQALAAAPLTSLYPDYTAHALRLRKVFDGADGRALPTFMEWQKWLKGDPLNPPVPSAIPEDPIGPGYNPKPYSGAAEAVQEPPSYVLDEIAHAHAVGLNTSVYTVPLVMNRNDWPGFLDQWLLRQRNGDYYPVAAGSPFRIVDFGATGVPGWMTNNLFDDIFDTAPGLGGVFFDLLSGSGSFLRYPAGGVDENPIHLRGYHGGTAYVAGTQSLFDQVRARIAAGKTTQMHPDIPFLPSETVQEFLAGRYDFGQQGLKSFPMQMQLNTLFDLLSGVPSIAPEASNPSPPLWNAVYHEWSRAEGLTVMLSVLGVNGPFLGGGQFDPAFPGLTWQRWGDYMRFVHALWWFQGSKPTSFQYLSGYGQYDLLVDDGVGGVKVRNPEIPQQQQLVDFLRELHHALDRHDEAGKFLNTGRMERPLQTPWAYDPLSILQSIGPSSDVATFVSPQSPGVRHFYERFFSTQPYAVPHVFHAVWRSVETGELGIVFVNWTDQPAWWKGLFDPSQYDGFASGAFDVHGIAPSGANVSEYLVGQGQGPTLLAWNPAAGGIALRHHDDAVPGLMPPRSVQVFVVRPR
ncbi:MAG: hypothetical protein U1F36_23355 [Planctomycetota bacterium]